MTALFCDLVGSTSLAERTDAEELDGLLRRYYALARSVIEQRTQRPEGRRTVRTSGRSLLA